MLSSDSKMWEFSLFEPQNLNMKLDIRLDCPSWAALRTAQDGDCFKNLAICIYKRAVSWAGQPNCCDCTAIVHAAKKTSMGNILNIGPVELEEIAHGCEWTPVTYRRVCLCMCREEACWVWCFHSPAAINIWLSLPSPQGSIQMKAKIGASTTSRRSGGSRAVRAHSHSPTAAWQRWCVRECVGASPFVWRALWNFKKANSEKQRKKTKETSAGKQYRKTMTVLSRPSPQEHLAAERQGKVVKCVTQPAGSSTLWVYVTHPSSKQRRETVLHSLQHG